MKSPFPTAAFGCGRFANCCSARRPKQEPLPFLDEHPLIRPLDDYAAIVTRAIHRQADRPSVGEGFERHDRTKTKSLTAPSLPGSAHKARRTCFRPGRDIPRQVAPLQSPAPFLPTTLP